jgi:hypothetical protein
MATKRTKRAPKVTNRYVYYAPKAYAEAYIYDRDDNCIVNYLDDRFNPLHNITNEMNALHKENQRLQMWVDRFYACLKQNEENGVWFQAVMDYEKKNAKK